MGEVTQWPATRGLVDNHDPPHVFQPRRQRFGRTDAIVPARRLVTEQPFAMMDDTESPDANQAENRVGYRQFTDQFGCTIAQD